MAMFMTALYLYNRKDGPVITKLGFMGNRSGLWENCLMLDPTIISILITLCKAKELS
jgi:hypothetical protein